MTVDFASGFGHNIDYNPAGIKSGSMWKPPEGVNMFQQATESGKKGWDFESWGKENPKTAGFLKGFMKSRGMTPGSQSGQGSGEKEKSQMMGLGGTTQQLASGLTETRDPFFMQTMPGQYIPGKKGLGRVALEAGLGAVGGFVTGGPMGAVGGTLGSFSQNMDQI